MPQVVVAVAVVELVLLAVLLVLQVVAWQQLQYMVATVAGARTIFRTTLAAAGEKESWAPNG